MGLNLKFNKKNEEVPGYTKKTEKEWLYSAAVEELLAEYLDRCVLSQEPSPLSFFFIPIKPVILNYVYGFTGFLKSSTQCPGTVMMMFSMKMTSGQDWRRMGKRHHRMHFSLWTFLTLILRSFSGLHLLF